jgi:hypothetical protein
MELKKVRKGDIVFITQALVRRNKKPLFVKDYYEVLERADTEGFIRVRNLFSGTTIRLRPVVMEPAKLRTILLRKETYEKVEARQKECSNMLFMLFLDTSIQFDRIATYLAVNKYKVEDILFKIKTPHNEKVIYATSIHFGIKRLCYMPFVRIIFNKFSKDFTGNEN